VTSDEINIDKQGRVCDKQGRPLRDRQSRTYQGAFKGEAGREHKRSNRLAERVKGYEAWARNARNTSSRRKPGSLGK
jgi:hypothetical protein